MEGSSLLILLEKILTGRPGDALKHAEYFNKLHESLLSANEATLRAAVLATQNLEDKGQINKVAAQKFLHYLKAIKDQKTPIPPELSYLTFSANPSSQKAAKLFHSLIRLSAKRTMLLKSGLDSFKKRILNYKNYQISIYHKAELKVQKCTSIIHVWLKSQKIRLGRALFKWRYFFNRNPRDVLLKILQKLELRIFYLKLVVVDKWKHETWVVEEINQIWEDEEVYIKTNTQRTKRMSVSDSFNGVRLNEILYLITNKAQYMGNTEFDSRVQVLNSFIVRQKSIRDQMKNLLLNIEEIVKQRKQLPLIILSKWQEKFVNKFEKISKFELALELIHKSQVKVKIGIFRAIQGFIEDNEKEGLRTLLKNLVENSLKYAQGRRLVLERLKNFQSSVYQTKVKYTKSVLNSVFKSTKSTQKTVMNTWKLLKTYENNLENRRKVKKFIKVLASALSSAAQIPLKFPDLLEKRENCLIRSVILACKNLRYVLNLTFQRWLKTNRSLISDRKALKKLALYSLNNIVKSNLSQALFTWKKQDLSNQASALHKKNATLQKNLKKKTLRSSKASAKNLISTLRCGGINRVLTSAFRKIVDKNPENLAKKILSGALTRFNKNFGKIFRTWEKNSKDLENEGKNRLSEGNVVKSTLFYLNGLVLKRVKGFFQAWLDEVNRCKTKLTSDQIRSLKLARLVQKVFYRWLKVSFGRITTATDKIFKSMENLYHSMKRKPKHAFDTWRFNAINIRKLNMISRLRAEKLCRVIGRVPNRYLRKSFNSVVGTSIKIKHAMKNLIECIRKKLRQRLTDWNNFCNFCAQAEIDLDFRMHKFCSLLSSPVKKPLRTVFSDLKPKTQNPQKPLKRLIKHFKKNLSQTVKNWKKKASEKSLHQKFESKIRGFKLSKLLELPIRSVLKSSFLSIFEWKKIITRALLKLSLAYNAQARVYFLKWKSIIDSESRKGAIHLLKILKIKGAFERILKRSLREASNRLMQGATKIEYTMEGLINGLKGIPRKAIRRWNKVIVEIKEVEMLNNIKGHKLMSIMQRIPRRLLRELKKKIDSNINVSFTLRYSFQSIERIVKKIPKQPFEIWKKFSLDVRNQSIIKDYNVQIIKINLEKIVKRTIRDTVNCLKKGPKTVKKALNTLIAGLMKTEKLAFVNWGNFVKLQQQNDVINGYKLKMMFANLNALIKKRTRDVYLRVLGGGDKFKGAIHGLINGLNNIPKIALKKWNKAVIELKEYELKTSLKGSKMLNSMKKVPVRVLKETCERIKGDIFLPKGLNGYLLNLYNIRKKRPKEAFDRWKKYFNIIDKNFLIDQLRQAKLQLTLTKIATRMLRNCLLLIMGEGNKIKGAFYIYISAILRRPKMAFDKWKTFVFEARHQKLLNHLKLYKLKSYFSKICARKLRDATQRIIGGGNKVKGAIQNIVSGLKNIPSMALLRWSKYTLEVKERRLMDNYRSEKLKTRLSNLVRRSLRRAFKRIYNEQASVALIKTMFRWLENIVTTGPKICFNQWKDSASESIKNKLRCTIKGQNVEKIFSRLVFKRKLLILSKILRPDKKIKQAISLCSNTIRKKPKIAFNRLKSFSEFSRRKGILSELAGERLKKCMESVVKKRFAGVFDRIQKFNETVNTVLVRISSYLKTKPKIALQKWHKNVENLKKVKNIKNFAGLNQFSAVFKGLLTARKRDALGNIQQFMHQIVNTRLHFRSLHKLFAIKPRGVLQDWLSSAKCKSAHLKISKIRGSQLSSHLNRLILHKFQNAQKTCQHFHNFHNKFTGSIRSLKRFICCRLKKRLNSWKQNTEQLKNEKLVKYLKSQKLRLALEKLSRKSLKDACQRIIGEGDKAKGALKRIIQKFQKRSKIPFARWRQHIADLSKQNLLHKIKGQKLKEYLLRLTKKPFAFLFKCLNTDKNKVKGAINTVINNLIAKPRQVIKKWRSGVQYIREKALIDFFRGEKLSTFAEKVVQRTRNDTFGRVTGKNFNPQMVYMNLKWVQKVFQQMARKAFNKWKDFVEEFRRQKLLSNIKSHKLMDLLGKASRKKLRDYVQRILGEGDKVKGAIKTVVSAIRTKTKEAYGTWLKFVDNASRQTILKKLKLQKFLQRMGKVVLRTMRLSIKRMLEDEDKVKIAVNTVVISLQVRPRHVIKKWKQNVQLIREKFLMKDVQSEKLRHSLENICKRTVRKALHRINSVQSNSIIAGINLKWINRILQRRPKIALDVWKEFIKALLKKSLNNEIISQKLRNALEKVSRRTYKSVLQRVFGEGNRVKGALKTIYLKINRLPQNAFSAWKKMIDDREKKMMFNELRSEKLMRSLGRIVVRTCKSVVARVSCGKNLLKEMITNMMSSLKAKRLQAFSKMRQNIQVKDLERLKLYSIGKNLQDSLMKLMKAKCNGLYDRFKNIVRTSGMQKIERLLKTSKLQKSNQLSSVFHEWKEKTLQSAWSSKLVQAKGHLIKQSLASPIRSTKLNSIKTLLKPKKILQKVFSRAETLKKSVKNSSFQTWKSSTTTQSNKRALNNYKALQILSKMVKFHSSSTYQRLTRQGKIFSFISKLVKSLESKQRHSILAFSENMRKKRLIDKINATFKVYKVLKSKPKIMLKGRFEYWKNLEELRLYRLRKKVLMKWIYMSSINYQNSFWKMKFVWNMNFRSFDPRHSLMYRKLSKIASNYQTRLKQYAHFKLVMYYKTMPYPIRRLASKEVNPLHPVNMKRNSEHRALAFIGKPENIAALSRAHTPTGYRKAFSRAHTPIGHREHTPTGFREDGQTGYKDQIVSGHKQFVSTEFEEDEQIEYREYISPGYRQYSPTGYREDFTRGHREHASTGYRKHTSTGSRLEYPERNVEIGKIEYNFE